MGRFRQRQVFPRPRWPAPRSLPSPPSRSRFSLASVVMRPGRTPLDNLADILAAQPVGPATLAEVPRESRSLQPRPRPVGCRDTSLADSTPSPGTAEQRWTTTRLAENNPIGSTFSTYSATCRNGQPIGTTLIAVSRKHCWTHRDRQAVRPRRAPRASSDNPPIVRASFHGRYRTARWARYGVLVSRGIR